MRSLYKPKFCLLLILLLVCAGAGAQTYNQVTHTSGKLNGVTVDNIGNAAIATVKCGATPFLIGNKGAGTLYSGYKFSFAEPVCRARFELTLLDGNEKLDILIDGIPYKIKAADLSGYPGICNSPFYMNLVNGRIFIPTGASNVGITIDIVIPGGFHSIQINDTVCWSNGTEFNFYYSGMPQTSIVKPFRDTMLCAGNSFELPYEVNGAKVPGNIFTVQLSDDTGSFATPRNIGTIASTTSGAILCTVPPDVKAGKRYRLRIIATDKPEMSFDNGADIRIDQPEIPEISSNSPVRSGGDINLYLKELPPDVSFSWSGPAGFSSNFPNPHIANAKAENAGIYIATTVDGACTGSALIVVKVLDVEDTGAFHLYPNPNYGFFKIQGLVTSEQFVTIQVCSVSGQVVYSQRVKTTGNLLDRDISLPSAASGAYYLKLNAEARNMVFKFMIKRE